MSGSVGLIVFMVIMIAAFSAALPSSFPTERNLVSILASQASLCILALAVMIPLVAGQFDLSVGSVLGLGAVMAVWLIGEQGLPWGVGVMAVLAFGAVVGAFNAFLVVKVGVSAFIATLGVATVLGGIAFLVTGGEVLFSGLPEAFVGIGQEKVWIIPLPFLYAIGLAVVLWYGHEHTPHGRYLTAIGLNPRAARLAGIKPGRFTAATFLISGILSAFAGVIESARLAQATPTGGPEFLLPAFAAAFLGATTIRRGQFNVWGTVVAVFFLAVGIVGLQQLGAPFWFQPVFNGGVLVIAVSATTILHRRRSREEG